MTYNPQQHVFTLTTLLKQGVIDYRYVWADEMGNVIKDGTFEGDYYETENDYQILIYYRAPGSRFDQLIAYTELNTVDKPRNF